MEVKREVDVFMSGYLKEETVGKEKAELFALSFDELNELEVTPGGTPWPEPPWISSLLDPHPSDCLFSRCRLLLWGSAGRGGDPQGRGARAREAH